MTKTIDEKISEIILASLWNKNTIGVNFIEIRKAAEEYGYVLKKDDSPEDICSLVFLKDLPAEDDYLPEYFECEGVRYKNFYKTIGVKELRPYQESNVKRQSN